MVNYNIREDAVFCYYCMKHDTKLTAEHNKKTAYISGSLRSRKKKTQYFRDHQATSCHLDFHTG